MNWIKKGISSALAASMLLSLFAGCGDGSSKGLSSGGGNSEESKEGASSSTINIAGILPLTGDVATYGVWIKEGAELAVEEINANGGILGGKTIVFDVQDDKGDSTETLNLYNKMAKNSAAIIGSATSKPSMALAEKAGKTDLPVITPSGTAEAITTYGDNIFRACFIDPFQGEVMANFTLNDLKVKNVAILYNNSIDYSTGVADTYKAALEAGGGTVVAMEAYGKDDTSFESQLTKLIKQNPEAVFIPDYYEKDALIASQARKVGLTVPLLGPDGWYGVTDVLTADNQSALDNTYFSTAFSTDDPSSINKNFVDGFSAKYSRPPVAFNALGYDTVYMLTQAMEEAGTTESKAVTEALKNINFEGVTGKMTFDENRNPIKPATIVKIEGGKYLYETKVEPRS